MKSALYHLPHIIGWGTGVVDTLLLTRLFVRLLAARPDNPFVAWLYQLTDPLIIKPFSLLDANQPQFGAVLELSTLSLAAVVLMVGSVLYRLASEAVG